MLNLTRPPRLSLRYCGRECQVAHWREHKPRCKTLKAERIDKLLAASGWASLSAVAAHGDLAAVRALVDAGACVNGLDSDDTRPPVFKAALFGHLEILQYLLDRGGDVNQLYHTSGTSWSTLYAAIQGNPSGEPGDKHPVPDDVDVTIVECLVEAGADVNFTDRQTLMTPFLHAAHYCNVPVMRALLKAGACVNPRDSNGCIPLLMCMQPRILGWEPGRSEPEFINADPLPALRVLLEELSPPADILTISDNHDSPIWIAASDCRDLDVVKYLTAKGAAIDFPNDQGNTPLIAAAHFGLLPMVCHLLRHGADMTRTVECCTPLAWAIRDGHHDVASLLSDVTAAGGWRKYAHFRHCRIRYRVGALLATLPVDDSRRELYHFVWGRNAVAAGEAEEEKPTMLVMPDDVFALVLQYLDGKVESREGVGR